MRHALNLKRTKAEEATEGEKVAVFFNHWTTAYMGDHIHFCLCLYLSQYEKIYILSGSLDFLKILKCLEVVSKPQIRFKGKAQADRESAAYV